MRAPSNADTTVRIEIGHVDMKQYAAQGFNPSEPHSIRRPEWLDEVRKRERPIKRPLDVVRFEAAKRQQRKHKRRNRRRERKH